MGSDRPRARVIKRDPWRGRVEMEATRCPPYATAAGAKLIHEVRFVKVTFCRDLLTGPIFDQLARKTLPPIFGEPGWHTVHLWVVYECAGGHHAPIYGESLDDPRLQHRPPYDVLDPRYPCERCVKAHRLRDEKVLRRLGLASPVD